MIKEKTLEILANEKDILTQNSLIDELLGITSALADPQIPLLIDDLFQNSFPRNVYASHFDLYKILEKIKITSQTSLVDLGTGLLRSKILFGILRPELSTIGIELIPERLESAKKAAKKLNLATEGFIHTNLLEYQIPPADYYLAYLETGVLLNHVLDQLLTLAQQKKITLITIDLDQNLNHTIEEDCPWLKKTDSILGTTPVSHNTGTHIYFWESIHPEDVIQWKKTCDQNIRIYIQKLMRNQILKWNEVPLQWRHLLLKKFSSSQDYDLIVNETPTPPKPPYQWLASPYQIRHGNEPETYQCLFPKKLISKNQIEGIIIPEDFWWKWRLMRFDHDDHKCHGKIRKIIISPSFSIDFSDGRRRHLSKVERGFKRIMKKRTVIHKKFEKQKEYNQKMAKEGQHGLILILDHLKPDFNIGKIFRSAEIFGVREIHIIGTSFFDPATALGSFKRVKAYFYESFEESYRRLKDENYSIFCLDSNTDNFLHQVELPQKTAFILGHEEFGPQFEKEKYKEIKDIKIQQFGMTESLNVSVAASIATYEYLRQIYL